MTAEDAFTILRTQYSEEQIQARVKGVIAAKAVVDDRNNNNNNNNTSDNNNNNSNNSDTIRVSENIELNRKALNFMARHIFLPSEQAQEMKGMDEVLEYVKTHDPAVEGKLSIYLSICLSISMYQSITYFSILIRLISFFLFLWSELKISNVKWNDEKNKPNPGKETTKKAKIGVGYAGNKIFSCVI